MEIKLHELTIREIAENYTDNNENGVTGYNGKLNIRPKYQREFVYDNKKRNAVMGKIVFKQPGEHDLGFAFLSFRHRVAVDPLKHEAAQLLQRLIHLGGKTDRTGFPGGLNGITHQGIDPLAVIAAQNVRNALRDILIGQDPCPDGVIDVVIHIGHLVGFPHHLAFQGLGDVVAGMA